MRWTKVGVAAVVLIFACSGPGATPSPTARQVLEARMKAFSAARSVTMAGHVNLSGTTYRVSLQADDHGQATGVVTTSDVALSVMLVGGRSFLNSGGYLAAYQIQSGKRWVLDSKGVMTNLLTTLTNRRELSRAMLAVAGPDVDQRQTTDATGGHVLKLTGAELSAFVPINGGGPPTRLVTALDTKLADGLTDVELDLSAYGDAAHIAVPDSYLDPNDKNSLLASYVFVAPQNGPNSFSFDSCDQSGCTMSAAFTNYGGRVGSSTATFYVTRGGNRLTYCDVSIPTVSNLETIRVGCRATFDGSLNVTGTVIVRNPQE